MTAQNSRDSYFRDYDPFPEERMFKRKGRKRNRQDFLWKGDLAPPSCPLHALSNVAGFRLNLFRETTGGFVRRAMDLLISPCFIQKTDHSFSTEIPDAGAYIWHINLLCDKLVLSEVF